MRRAVSAALLLLGAITLALFSTTLPSTAQAEGVEPGSAHASGQVLRIKPFYAGLAIPVPLGLSISSYQNQRARALGAAADLSAVGALVDLPPDAPKPISIDSTEGDAEHRGALGGDQIGRTELAVTDGPTSSSEVRLADVAIAGLVVIAGGTSRATTAFVDGQRTASASVQIASVVLADGLIGLHDLRWEARHQTGRADAADAQFTLGGITVAGLPVPIGGEELSAVLSLVNTLLAPTGLVIDPPRRLSLPDGSVDMTSLRIALANSPIGVAAIGPTTADLRPTLLPIIDALAAVDESLGVAALVLDIGLGVVDGSGGVELAIGGANARTDPAAFEPAAGQAAPDIGSSSTSAGWTPRPSLPGLPVPAAAPAPAVTPPGLGPSLVVEVRCVLAGSPQRSGGCRSHRLPAAIAVTAIVLVSVGSRELAVRRRQGTTAGAPT